MESLQIDDNSYERSVAFDGASKNDTTVTVGVETTRRQEARLLDICCDEQTSQYRPFATKSRDLDLDAVPIERLMGAFPGRVAVALCSAAPDDSVRTEAAQSAVLYDELTPFESATVAIADGDERHAELLGMGLRALGDRKRAVVACQRSELYYPQSYFADLLAGAVVRRRAGTGGTLLNDFDRVADVDSDGDRFWKAYNQIGAGRYDYQLPGYEKQVRREAATRAMSWFTGAFEGGDEQTDRPLTDSTRRIEMWLRNNDYDAVADRI